MNWLMLIPFAPALLGGLFLLSKKADKASLMLVFILTVTFTWLLSLPLCKAITLQLLAASVPGVCYGMFLAGLLWSTTASDVEEETSANNALMFCFALPILIYLFALPFFTTSWLLAVDVAAGLITAAGLLLLQHPMGAIIIQTGQTFALLMGLVHTHLLVPWLLVAVLVIWFVYTCIGIYWPRDSKNNVERYLIGSAICLWLVWIEFGRKGIWWHFALTGLMVFVLLAIAAQSETFRRVFLCESLGSFCVIVMPTTWSLVAFSVSASNWNCSQWPAFVCESWPWPILLLPSGLYGIYLIAQGCVELVEPKIRAETPATWSKLTIWAILVMLPVLLQVNVPTLFTWAQVPNVNITHYISADVNFMNRTFAVHLRNSSMQLIGMPQPLWPAPDKASEMRQARTLYWSTFMMLKYVGATAVSMLLLRCGAATGWCQDQTRSYQRMEHEQDAAHDPEEQQPGRAEETQHTTEDSDRRRVLVTVVLAHLSLCTKLCLSAAFTEELTDVSGLAWEGYDLIQTAGLAWLLAQAAILRAANCQLEYGPVDVALGTLFLLPFLGDGCDTLKDAMLASVALKSSTVWVRNLGGLAMAYLWFLHVVILLPRAEGRLELEQSYLTILLLLPMKSSTRSESSFFKVCKMFYHQSTPTRRWGMLLEDIPQGILTIIIASVDGFRAFTFVVNLAIPLLRYALARCFHEPIAYEVRDWLLDQAVDALEAKRAEIAIDRMKALCRLQQIYPDLWKAFGAECQQRARDTAAAQSELPEATGESKAFASWVRLQDLAADSVSIDTVQRDILLLLKVCGLEASGRAACALKHVLSNSALTLDLKKCGLDDAVASGLGQALSQLDQVQELVVNLRSNGITPTGYEGFCQPLSTLKPTTKLRIHAEGNATATAWRTLPRHTELVLHYWALYYLTGNELREVCESGVARMLVGDGRGSSTCQDALATMVAEDGGDTLAHFACMRAHLLPNRREREAKEVEALQVLELLQKAGCDLMKANKDGETPAHWAAYNGHVEVLKMFHAAGCDLSETDKKGNAPLHRAVLGRQEEAVEFLLRHVDPNQPGACGAHAVDLAADRDYKYNGGETPAHWAAYNGHVEVLEVLQKAGCDLSETDKNGQTPAHWAARNGHVEVLEVLHKAGCDLSKTDKDGNAPLHRAVLGMDLLGSQVRAVEFLVRHVDPNQPGQNQLRAMDMSSDYCFMKKKNS